MHIAHARLAVRPKTSLTGRLPSAEWLERGGGEEVRRGDPRDDGAGTEGVRDGGQRGRDDRGVEARDEDAECEAEPRKTMTTFLSGRRFVWSVRGISSWCRCS